MEMERVFSLVHGPCLILLRLLCLTAVPPTLCLTVWPFCVPFCSSRSGHGFICGCDGVAIHALGLVALRVYAMRCDLKAATFLFRCTGTLGSCFCFCPLRAARAAHVWRAAHV